MSYVMRGSSLALRITAGAVVSVSLVLGGAPVQTSNAQAYSTPQKISLDKRSLQLKLPTGGGTIVETTAFGESSGSGSTVAGKLASSTSSSESSGSEVLASIKIGSTAIFGDSSLSSANTASPVSALIIETTAFCKLSSAAVIEASKLVYTSASNEISGEIVLSHTKIGITATDTSADILYTTATTKISSFVITTTCNCSIETYGTKVSYSAAVSENSSSNINVASPVSNTPYWPLPSEVAFGVIYGPTGNDYTGTYIDNKLKLELETSRLFKPLSDKIGILV